MLDCVKMKLNMPRNKVLLRQLMIIGIILCVGQIIITVYHYQTHTTPYAIVDEDYITRIKAVGTNNASFLVRDKEHVSVIPKVSSHLGNNGLILANKTHACINSENTSVGVVPSIFSISKKRVMFCPMEKVGTTFWRRVFVMQVSINATVYKQPYDVPIDTAFAMDKTYTLPFSELRKNTLLAESVFNFIFVRNPYSRLLSAFVDKLVAPNPIFWKVFGARAISNYRLHNGSTERIIDGHDVSFAEFVKHVVNAEKTGKHLNAHFASTFRSCKPCEVNYQFIGRMESFANDAMFILKKLDMNSSVDRLEHSFSELSVDDAIMDSIYSPFSWKHGVTKVISWDKALRRVWLKLQMRGIVGLSHEFSLTSHQVTTYTADQFVEYARTAHKNSNPSELKLQKEQVKKDAFRSVPLKDLIEFRDTFKNDFVLFGYETTPDYVFSRAEKDSPTNMFYYPHLN